MRKTLILIIFFCINSCSTVSNKKHDFYFNFISYKEGKISQTYLYDNFSGILIKSYPDSKITIKMTDEEIQRIYNLYKRLGLKNRPYCSIIDNNKSGFKINITVKNIISDNNCINDQKYEDKYLEIYIKIREILKNKAEYQKVFPWEFEEL